MTRAEAEQLYITATAIWQRSSDPIVCADASWLLDLAEHYLGPIKRIDREALPQIFAAKPALLAHHRSK